MSKYARVHLRGNEQIQKNPTKCFEKNVPESHSPKTIMQKCFREAYQKNKTNAADKLNPSSPHLPLCIEQKTVTVKNEQLLQKIILSIRPAVSKSEPDTEWVLIKFFLKKPKKQKKTF